MTTGLAAWLVGAIMWTYDETLFKLGLPTWPSTADAAFLLFPVCAAIALLLLSTANKGQLRVRLVLDAVIIATSLFVVSWVTVLDHSIHAVPSQAGKAVWLAYVVADVVVVALAMLAWAGARPARRLSFALLVGGISLMALANLAVAYLNGLGGDQSDDYVDVVRLAAFGLIGLAALWSQHESPHEKPPAQKPFGAGLWLPYLAVTVTAVVWLGQVFDEIGPSLLIAAVVMVVALLGRQFVVILENQRLLSDVSLLAFRDQLTGLANRALFLDHLRHAVARHRRERAPVAVLCLDLDDFKTVNDELGHPAGDELLVRVAGRLTDCVRNSDTVARLGGDEFAVLLEGSVDAAMLLAERILDAFRVPIEVDGVALTARPSIGLTVASVGNATVTVDTLLRDADLAMYAAKRDGGGCLRVFVQDHPYPYEARRPTHTETDVTSPQPVSTTEPAPQVQVAWQPPSGVWVAVGVVLIGLVVFGISTILRTPGRNVVLDSWLYTGLTVAAAALVAARAWRVADERWAWLLISVGMACSAFADAVYAVWAGKGESPSLADVLYLAFYPFVYAGLLLAMRTRLRRVPAAIRLDAFIVGLTLAAAGFAVGSGLTGSATQGPAVTVLIGLAYPIGDLLLLALAGGMVAILGSRAGRPWVALVAGFALFAVADTVYLFQTSEGAYREGTWIDFVWVAACLLVALAAWLPTSPAKPRLRTNRLAPSVACTLVALAVLVLGEESRPALLLAAMALTAVAARYGVMFRQVSALAEGHQQAMTDDVTGLANRRALATALTAGPGDGHESADTERTPRTRALLLLDLDQFGEINDSLGRGVGNELLSRVAKRLAESVRPDGLLARTGSDDFAILLPYGTDLVTARAQAGALTEAMKEPFALDRITVQVDARVAIAMYPDHCAHPEELLSRAEAAMAYAMTAGGAITVYDPALDRRTNDDAWLVEDLTRALDADELTCHYQPKINAHDDRVHSIEALVRWRHPTRGLLLPDEFLPAAEHAGLMRSVTTRVLDVALAQIRKWRDEGIMLTVAVNLSSTNLLDVDLVDTIDRLLQKHRLPVGALILEITDSQLTTDSQRSRNTVAALRQLGIRLSLDDYGTGWSSLARLQELSVDELKLDKIFVARLANDLRSSAIVRSTVALAHSLGADLVAEGVEDVDTLIALRLYGCNITQGNVHSPPLPADQFQGWLIRRNRLNLEVSAGVR